MKFLPLIWAGLWRKRARTIFTLLSIAVAFVLYGMLAGINAGFAHALETSRLDRLFADPRFGTPTPLSYAEQIARVPGVTVVAPRWGMGGYYQDPKNQMGIIGSDERFFLARSELAVSKKQIETLLRTRTGAIAGVYLANKYGWKVGDNVPIQTSIAKQDGSRVWTFDIVAIVEDVDHPGQAEYFVTNYKYLDEGRTTDKGTIDRFLIRIDNPNHAVQIGRAIDHLFANSSAPTRTVSERSELQSGLQSLGDVNFFVDAVVGAVFFMLLFLTGNTMMQSFRERIPEFAVLKTLGYSDIGVLALVFAESILLCVLAGVAGLVVAKIIIPSVSNYFDIGDLVLLPWNLLFEGLVMAILVALASGLVPGLRAKRLSVVNALARRGQG